MSHQFDSDTTADTDTPWADFGRCVGVDPDVFFPRRGHDPAPAKSLCRQCAVRSQCLEWALDTNQKHGIWGGMTEGQRRRLRRPIIVSAESVTEPTRSAPARHLHLVR
ncbi:MAG: WhiB family transcriptional regulator [Ilumatobacteraceae bacterium]